MVKLILRCSVPLLLMLICFGLALATLSLDEKIYREGAALKAKEETLAVVERENRSLRFQAAQGYSCAALAERLPAE